LQQLHLDLDGCWTAAQQLGFVTILVASGFNKQLSGRISWCIAGIPSHEEISLSSTERAERESVF
jgi:hypothetical protein